MNISVVRMGVLATVILAFASVTNADRGDDKTEKKRESRTIWVEFDGLPNGTLFGSSKDMIEKKGVWFKDTWQIVNPNTGQETRWWTFFPERVNLDGHFVRVEADDKSSDDATPHLRFRLPLGNRTYKLARFVLRVEDTEYEVPAITLTLPKQEMGLIIVKLDLKPMETSQILADSRFCLAASERDACIDRGQIFAGTYVLRYRPGQRKITGRACEFSYDNTSCDAGSIERFKQTDQPRTSCKDHAVQVACKRDNSGNGTSTVGLYYSKYVEYGPEMVRLCSTKLGCSLPKVGDAVQIRANAGTYRFQQFKY